MYIIDYDGWSLFLLLGYSMTMIKILNKDNAKSLAHKSING